MNTVREIAEAVAAETGVPVADIMSSSRKRIPVHARWEVWKRLAALGWSAGKIGRPWGYDHSTVMHGLDKIGGKLIYPRTMETLRAKEEARRAEMIRQYWAKRGVQIQTRIETFYQRKHKDPVHCVRAAGIPVRADV